MRPLKKPSKRVKGVVALLLALLLALTGLALTQVESSHVVITPAGCSMIDPMTAPSMKGDFKPAHHTDTQLAAVWLDIPDGFDNAMRRTVQIIPNSDIPITISANSWGAQCASIGFINHHSGQPKPVAKICYIN